jgi:hypothetical protein
MPSVTVHSFWEPRIESQPPVMLTYRVGQNRVYMQRMTDHTYGDFPAQNTVYTPIYIYIYIYIYMVLATLLTSC